MSVDPMVREDTEHLIIELFDVLAWFSEGPLHERHECLLCAQWWERRNAVMNACRERWQ